ncbi:archaeal ribosomal protein L6P [Caldisphaera lagunensis DSM 15908]|uniref:Large ribosomal subunit protein uL6 n=1 Tax=Caldisphaera lagunensis (strain DSM 15908 / JCM 11604 / ANMR 0165 / IC-154) TaxID=1056495 RepID=L0AAF6_CALLD|nr:archaeal ribosomal protein L6P [Caldisphaera lagunensis DSM 15908]
MLTLAKEVHAIRELEIPDGIDIKIDGKKIKVKGPKGELERDFSHIKDLSLRLEDKKLIAEVYFADAKKKAVVGTVIAHVKNMITGVTKGYRYKLKIIYSHYPISVKKDGNKIIISNFIGEKSPRIAKVFPGVNVKVQGTDIILEGIDIEKVSQSAANIELATKISDFDRRKFMDGIYIYSREVIE